ncbi:MAG TPA: hypothetical protein VNW04_23505 [Puia sp.]|nr:hypothetical protein [Puia sp.]
MKKTTTVVLAVMLLAVTTIQLKAQDLNASLKEALHSLQSATNMGGLMAANNKFDLIAGKWGNQWAANYYAAYSDAYISLQEKDAKRRDQLLDMADKYVDKMNGIDANSDESLVVTAFVAFARFQVDPANRWQKYLSLMTTDLEKAKKVNPDNPRVYYLQGVPLFFRPKTYGGGKDVAKPYFAKAKDLFAKEDAANSGKPAWGEKENADYLAKCSE